MTSHQEDRLDQTNGVESGQVAIGVAYYAQGIVKDFDAEAVSMFGTASSEMTDVVALAAVWTSLAR